MGKIFTSVCFFSKVLHLNVWLPPQIFWDSKTCQNVHANGCQQRFSGETRLQALGPRNGVGLQNGPRWSDGPSRGVGHVGPTQMFLFFLIHDVCLTCRVLFLFCFFVFCRVKPCYKSNKTAVRCPISVQARETAES